MVTFTRTLYNLIVDNSDSGCSTVLISTILEGTAARARGMIAMHVPAAQAGGIHSRNSRPIVNHPLYSIRYEFHVNVPGIRSEPDANLQVQVSKDVIDKKAGASEQVGVYNHRVGVLNHQQVEDH